MNLTKNQCGVLLTRVFDSRPLGMREEPHRPQFCWSHRHGDGESVQDLSSGLPLSNN